MAAIYSGIHQKIKNSKIPWEKKLKLAHFAWINHQCFIPNKEQVLLDWVIHTLFGHHTKKLNLDEDVEQKLWCFMESILHSKRLRNLLKEGKPVKFRFSIAQLLNNLIACSATQESSPTGIGTVLSCCQCVLSNPALSVVYTTKYELLLDLLSCWTDKNLVQSLEMEIQDLFTLIMEDCMCEEFYTIMNSILHGLEMTNMWENNYMEIFAGITLTRLMLNCQLNEEKRKLFWFTASQIISALVTLGKEACKDHFLLRHIVGSVLDTIALLLRRGETDLLNPHHVTLSFSILLVVPLDHLRTEEYYSLFISIHEVLFSILQCHSKAMLKAVSTFLSSFHRLVASVMHEGQMKTEKGASCESETILKCAQLVERMYTYIAAKTEAFTVFSTSIVSQYVHELQKVTLHSAVKKHLTEGIFHIMDLCIDRDVKFLNASLQMEAREVFKELYHEYITQHKAKGHGEEKYTV